MLSRKIEEAERKLKLPENYTVQLAKVAKEVDEKIAQGFITLDEETKQKLRMGEWTELTVDSFKLNTPETTPMGVFNVVATRKLTIPQPDGALLSVERIVVDKTVIANDSNTAAFIAGKGVEATDEELSLATVKVIVKA